MFASASGGERKAFIYHPTGVAAPGRPWVMYAPTLAPDAGGTPDIELAVGGYFQQWRAAGIACAGVDIGDNYGAPPGRLIYTDLYNAMVAAGYSTTPAMLARSRGGLMIYEWAADNPTKVSCIAGVYPAGDLASFPGLSSAGLQAAWGMTEAELSAALPTINPVNRLADLAANGVPIYHVHGDSDVVVPIGPNSQTVKNNYDALSGTMTLEIIPGAGHSGFEQEFFFNSALVAFVINNCT